MSTTPTHRHRQGETHSNGRAPAAPVQQPDRFAYEGLKAERQRMYAARAVNRQAPTAYQPRGYDGAELRPYIGRPDAMHAQALPSRFNNRLHYRDGRVTDLAGQPLTENKPS